MEPQKDTVTTTPKPEAPLLRFLGSEMYWIEKSGVSQNCKVTRYVYNFNGLTVRIPCNWN